MTADLEQTSKRLSRAVRRRRTLRVIGFDDAPFERGNRGASVSIAGAVCAGTRFEGLLWTKVQQDGFDATRVLVDCLSVSKFLPQLHLVLLDGLAFGGFNVVDLPLLARELGVPCVACTRRPPDFPAVKRALARLSRPERRWALMMRAGEIHSHAPFFYQVAGADPDLVGVALERVTDRGHVPEALRLAHLIGSAVVTGESGRRA